MKMGAVLLSVWSGLNAAVALAVTVMTLLGKPPPALALLMTYAQIQAADATVLAVVNAQAAIANPLIMAVCFLVLVLVWKGIVPGTAWAYWAVASALVPVQVFGFVSDGYLGHHNMVANAVSSVVLGAGLVLSKPGS